MAFIDHSEKPRKFLVLVWFDRGQQPSTQPESGAWTNWFGVGDSWLKKITETSSKIGTIVNGLGIVLGLLIVLFFLFLVIKLLMKFFKCGGYMKKSVKNAQETLKNFRKFRKVRCFKLIVTVSII